MFNSFTLFDLFGVLTEKQINTAFFTVYEVYAGGDMQRAYENERYNELPAYDLREMRVTGIYAKNDSLYISVTIE